MDGEEQANQNHCPTTDTQHSIRQVGLSAIRALCGMFNRAIRRQLWMPKYIGSDNDPLYRFHQGKPRCGYWRRQKSSPSPTTLRCPTRSWKANRHPSARVLGPRFVLKDGRPRSERLTPIPSPDLQVSRERTSAASIPVQNRKTIPAEGGAACVVAPECTVYSPQSGRWHTKP